MKDITVFGISEPQMVFRKSVKGVSIEIPFKLKNIFYFDHSDPENPSLGALNLETNSMTGDYHPDSWTRLNRPPKMNTEGILGWLENNLFLGICSSMEDRLNNSHNIDYGKIFLPAPIDYWKEFIKISSLKNNNTLLRAVNHVLYEDRTSYKVINPDSKVDIEGSEIFESEGIYCKSLLIEKWLLNTGELYAER